MVGKKRHALNLSELMQAVQKELHVNQAQKKEACRQLRELLYRKWNITMEQIETCCVPFEQAGYLSTKQKFDIMLYLASKEAYGDGRKQLFAHAGWKEEERTEITQRDVEGAYLRFLEEEWIRLEEADKKILFTEWVYEPFGYGIVEQLLGQETEGIFAGELFWKAYGESGRRKDLEGGAGASEYGIGILEQGRVIRLGFLCFANKEELCRITKRLVCIGGKGELTVAEPEWKMRCTDGTIGHAVRPPKSEGWGFEIIRAEGGIYEAGGGIRWI